MGIRASRGGWVSSLVSTYLACLLANEAEFSWPLDYETALSFACFIGVQERAHACVCVCVCVRVCESVCSLVPISHVAVVAIESQEFSLAGILCSYVYYDSCLLLGWV